MKFQRPRSSAALTKAESERQQEKLQMSQKLKDYNEQLKGQLELSKVDTSKIIDKRNSIKQDKYDYLVSHYTDYFTKNNGNPFQQINDPEEWKMQKDLKLNEALENEIINRVSQSNIKLQQQVREFSELLIETNSEKIVLLAEIDKYKQMQELTKQSDIKLDEYFNDNFKMKEDYENQIDDLKDQIYDLKIQVQEKEELQEQIQNQKDKINHQQKQIDEQDRQQKQNDIQMKKLKQSNQENINLLQNEIDKLEETIKQKNLELEANQEKFNEFNLSLKRSTIHLENKENQFQQSFLSQENKLQFLTEEIENLQTLNKAKDKELDELRAQFLNQAVQISKILFKNMQ